MLNPFIITILNCKKTNMNQKQIAIEIFNDLFNEEQKNELINKVLVDISEYHTPIFPESFPIEIDKPIIIDGYGNQDFSGEKTINEEIILGTYTPMNSPGIITFNRNNIKRYSGSLIRKVVNSGISLGLDTALFTIYFVVEDIMKHESFHYYCDYKRQLTGSKFDRDKEEAFAVAHSYQETHTLNQTFHHAFIYDNDYNSFFSNYFHNAPNIQLCENRMTAIFNFLHKEHYKGFSSPGYKDWYLYKGLNCYETHYFDYLKNSKLDTLLENGVPVNDISWEISRLENKGANIQLI